MYVYVDLRKNNRIVFENKDRLLQFVRVTAGSFVFVLHLTIAFVYRIF